MAQLQGMVETQHETITANSTGTRKDISRVISRTISAVDSVCVVPAASEAARTSMNEPSRR